MLHIKKIIPRNNDVIVTGNKYEHDEYKGGIIVANKGDLKTNQEVIAVGSFVRDLKPGDKIVFNPLRYAERKHVPNSVKNDLDIMNEVVKWHLPWVTIEDEEGNPHEYLKLLDADILYSYEGYEKSDTVIVPPKKSILLN